jgi:hypothetical protein
MRWRRAWIAVHTRDDLGEKMGSCRLRRALGLLIGIPAILWTMPSTAGPAVAPMPDGSPSSAQMLLNALLSPYAQGTINVVAGSVAYKGAPFASGLFSNGGSDSATTIGIDSGVLLTSGDARFVSGNPLVPEDVANKNAYSTAGAGNALTINNSPGDALFATVTSSPTFNASILGFQFIPAGDTLKLTYVFGSEDYNNWVNSGIPTDAIGIFVNGVNYAVVPGTTTPISASTVNCGGPSSGAATGSNAQNCELYRDNPPFVGAIDTELNGLTVTLTVTAPVTAGQVNTVQIGIADAFDTFYDSALFLKGTSLGVFYTFDGFFDPVANAPSINARNAGSSVPVSFSLNGYKGPSPFTVASQQIDCASGQPIGALEAASAAGGSGIQYDSVNDAYQYNWKTDRQYAQTCRQLVVTLNDGTHHVAYFEFH